MIPKIEDAAIDAAMDAYYEDEDWRGEFSRPSTAYPQGVLALKRDEWRSAINAALKVLQPQEPSN